MSWHHSMTRLNESNRNRIDTNSTSSNSSYNHRSDLNKQRQSCRKLLRRFPGRIPVIVERLDSNNSPNGGNKSKPKWLKNVQLFNNNNSNQRKIDSNDDGSKLKHHRINNGKPSIDMNKKQRLKFLVPYNCTIGQFQWILRNRIDLISTSPTSSSSSSNNAIYLIVNHTLPHASCLIGELYRQNQTLYNNDNDDNDGYLYIYYSDENTFG